MKLTVISLIFLFMQFVSAVDFNLTSPNSVSAEQEFTISINLSEESSAIFDVKAFAHQPLKEYSEIFNNGEWKSPHFYLRAAFPATREFKLKSHYVGETQVCIRLRETGQNSFSEKCNLISILPNNVSNISNGENSENSSANESGTSEHNSQNETEQESYNNSITRNEIFLSNQEKKKEKIILNPETTQNKEKLSGSITTKQQRIRDYTIYSFLVFLIVVIILLALKKL